MFNTVINYVKSFFSREISIQEKKENEDVVDLIVDDVIKNVIQEINLKNEIKKLDFH